MNDNPLVQNNIQKGFNDNFMDQSNLNFEEVKSDYDEKDLAMSMFTDSHEILQQMNQHDGKVEQQNLQMKQEAKVLPRVVVPLLLMWVL